MSESVVDAETGAEAKAQAADFEPVALNMPSALAPKAHAAGVAELSPQNSSHLTVYGSIVDRDATCVKPLTSILSRLALGFSAALVWLAPWMYIVSLAGWHCRGQPHDSEAEPELLNDCMRLWHAPIFSLARNLAEQGGYNPNAAFAVSYMLLPLIFMKAGVAREVVLMISCAFLCLFVALYFHDLVHVSLNAVGIIIGGCAMVLVVGRLKHPTALHRVLVATATFAVALVVIIAKGPYGGKDAYYNMPLFSAIEWVVAFLGAIDMFLMCAEDWAASKLKMTA